MTSERDTRRRTGVQLNLMDRPSMRAGAATTRQNVGVDDYSGGYQIGSASYLLVLLPVLIVYIFCQKWIMNGVVAGAVK